MAYSDIWFNWITLGTLCQREESGARLDPRNPAGVAAVMQEQIESSLLTGDGSGVGSFPASNWKCV